MQKYLTYFKTEFINYLEYRTAFFSSFFSLFLSLFIQLFFAQAIYASKESVFGYSLEGFITYIFFSSIVGKVVETDIHHTLPRQIRSGDLSNILIKPVKYNLLRLFGEFSWKIHTIIYNLVISFLISIIYLTKFNFSIANIPLFTISLVLSYLLNRSFKFCIGCIAFWIKDTNGISNFTREIVNILGGKWMPLEFFGVFFKFISLLPFSYIYYFPLQILTGSNIQIDQIFEIIFIEIIWIVLFFSLGKLLWNKGIKHFKAVGI